MPNIDPKQFQLSHTAMLAVVDEAERQIGNLQLPYKQSIVYALRRGLYKIEKASKSLSLKLLPMLAYELEAFAAEMAKTESKAETNATPDESTVTTLLQRGLELIRQAMLALARGEREASADSAAQIGQLVSQLREQRDAERHDLDLTASESTLLQSNDELDNFEQSLQAMQQELLGVLTTKPSSKPSPT